MKFIELLKDFWKGNLSKNYKKISIAIGGILNGVLAFLFLTVLTDLYPYYKELFIIIQSGLAVVIISLFGYQNGNGKEIEKVKEENMKLKKKLDILEEKRCRDCEFWQFYQQSKDKEKSLWEIYQNFENTYLFKNPEEPGE